VRQDGFGGTHRAGAVTLSGARWVVTGANQSYDGSVTIESPATIVTEQDLTHAGTTSGRFDGQFQIPTSGVTLTKQGPGSLILAGSQGYAPGAVMQVTGGTVRFVTDPGAGWYTGNFTRGADDHVSMPPKPEGTLDVLAGGAAGASVEFAAPVSRLASLTLEAGGTGRVVPSAVPGGRTLMTKAFTITDGGQMDVSNNRLVIDYDAGHSPLSSVADWVKTGFATPASRWQGPGIISSSAAADGTMGVGFAEAADVLRLSVRKGQTSAARPSMRPASWSGSRGWGMRISTAGSTSPTSSDWNADSVEPDRRGLAAISTTTALSAGLISCCCTRTSTGTWTPPARRHWTSSREASPNRAQPPLSPV
jgi:hypothetical protein